MTQFADIRRNMVDTQLRTYDVTSKKLLDAIEKVAREHFVPESLHGLAYVDQPVVLTSGEQETRTLLTPMVLARMIQAAEIEAGQRVLDVAAGSGYGSAIMQAMGAKVTILETPAMAEFATAALKRAGVSNVEVKSGALNRGLPKAEAFDVILVNGSLGTEPKALLAQLRDGGRLVAIIGAGRSGRVTVYQKSGDATGSRAVLDASAPSLSAFRAEPAFQF